MVFPVPQAVGYLNTNAHSKGAFVARLYPALRKAGFSKGGAQLLVAHSAISTGWGRAIPNHNFFGIKAGRSNCENGTTEKPWRDYVCLDTFEFTKARKRIGIKAPFAAFRDADHCAEYMWWQLHRPRYAGTIAKAQAGDLGYFVQLGKDGWYTASPEQIDSDGRKNAKLVADLIGGDFTNDGYGIAGVFAGVAAILAIVGLAR